MPTMREVISALEQDIAQEKRRLDEAERYIPIGRARLKKATKLLDQLNAVYAPAVAQVDVRGDDGRHLCDVCGASFDLFQELEDHKRREHVAKPDHDGPNLTCRYCGKTFDGPQGRAAHERSGVCRKPEA